MHSTSRRVWITAATVWGLSMATGPPAWAVRRFPEEIKAIWLQANDPTPPCRLCHIQGTTGPGSVQTPFGVAMHARGLTSDQGTLQPALDALEADKVDSDGDGVPDSVEVKMNRDPNTPVDVPLSSTDPTYGCTTAPRSPGTWAAALALLLAALLGAGWLVRTPRRSRPRRPNRS